MVRLALPANVFGAPLFIEIRCSFLLVYGPFLFVDNNIVFFDDFYFKTFWAKFVIERRKMTAKFDLIKKMLKGSTTMPQGTAMGASNHVHYHDGVACTHDHSKDEDHSNHHHHEDGSCCDHDHSKDK